MRSDSSSLHGIGKLPRTRLAGSRSALSPGSIYMLLERGPGAREYTAIITLCNGAGALAGSRVSMN